MKATFVYSFMVQNVDEERGDLPPPFEDFTVGNLMRVDVRAHSSTVTVVEAAQAVYKYFDDLGVKVHVFNDERDFYYEIVQ